MSTYQVFASVYDQLMKDIPYDKWVAYILDIMKKYKCEPELLLDIGCGTGNITQLLSREGYDMIGIDNSEDMLLIAEDKAKENNLDILYLMQDMREFELFGTVGCIVSICDSLNYILEEKELLEVFKLANNYLDPKGLFIFDMNTVYKYKNILDNNTFARSFKNSAYIWENYYYEEESINEYLLTLFIENQKSEYNRFNEIHLQKAYTKETIIRLIEKSGLEFVDVFDAFTFTHPKKESDRIYYIAREKGK